MKKKMKSRQRREGRLKMAWTEIGAPDNMSHMGVFFLWLRPGSSLGVVLGQFSDLFLTQWHTNLRGWGYIFIAGQDNQAYADMLV
jgi:hypothetical protein